LNIDAITLGLLVVAVLPWFSDLLQSAKFPGGWEVNFREIKNKQDIIQNNQQKQERQIDEQEKQIQRLTLLMNSFLSQNQLECLRAMSINNVFWFDKNSGVVEQAKEDIRRLFAAGFISRRPGRGFRTLFEGETKQNVNDHFCITDQGRQFLELLNPDET
jgi:hypothetical protein